MEKTRTFTILAHLLWAWGPGPQDLFGLLFSMDTGKKYIAVFTDTFSKYVELAAIPDKSAITVATAFLEKWDLCHSVPHEFVTDQGKEFYCKCSQGLGIDAGEEAHPDIRRNE